MDAGSPKPMDLAPDTAVEAGANEAQSASQPAAAAAAAPGTPAHEQQEEQAVLEVRRAIGRWIEDNRDEVDLELKLVSDYLLEFVIGPTKITFQVGTDERWRPSFVQSGAELLAEYLTPINVWIEEQSQRNSFSVTELLDHVAQHFKQAARELMSGNLSADMTAKLLAEWEAHKSDTASRKKTKSSSSNEALPTGDKALVDETAAAASAAAVAAMQAPPAPRERVFPTAADFEAEILPALRAFLQGENFRPYQIDEWVRRVRVEVEKGHPENMEEALRIVKEEALGGSELPAALEKFYAPEVPLIEQYLARAAAAQQLQEQQNGNDNAGGGAAEGLPMPPAMLGPGGGGGAPRRLFPARERQPRYVRDGLSPQAADRLTGEANSLVESNRTKLLGFTAAPINQCLAHWELTLLGDSFDATSFLGMQLMEWTMHHSLSGGSGSGVIRPADVQVEMLMPREFPTQGPIFRVISPRFQEVNQLNLALSQSMDASNPAPAGRGALTFSRDLEDHDGGWSPANSSVADVAAYVRRRLETAQVDLEAGKDGVLATVGGFWTSYVCMLPAVVGKPEQEHTGQIALPASALERLFGGGRRHQWDGGLAQSGGPMTFEVSSTGGRRSFCGVGEFTADEGSVVMPQWMATNLGVQLGEEVHVRRVHVPKGVYMKLQPHTAAYARAGNTKRMLEWVLRRYTAVATGDTLVINFRGEEHKFEILDVSPGRAIRLIDSDVAVDFAPPLSGETVPKYAEDDDGNILDETELGGVAAAAAGSSAAAAAPAAGFGGAAPGAGAGGAAVAAPPAGQQLGQVDGVEGVDWRRCGNCRKGIPLATFDRHQLMCAKHNWYCELCGVSVEKRQQEQHIQEQHANVFCACGRELEQRHLAQHKLADCPLRRAKCAFCSLAMTYREIWAHEKECGAKTEKCTKCGQFVRIRDWPGHDAVCGVPDVDSGTRSWGGGGAGGDGGGMDDWGAVPTRGGSPPKYGGFRPRGREAPRDDYLLCPHCNEPCEQLDDLQVHMLVTHPDAPAVDFGAPTAQPHPAKPQTPPPFTAAQAANLAQAFEAFKFEMPPAVPDGGAPASDGNSNAPFKFTDLPLPSQLSGSASPAPTPAAFQFGSSDAEKPAEATTPQFHFGVAPPPAADANAASPQPRQQQQQQQQNQNQQGFFFLPPDGDVGGKQ